MLLVLWGEPEGGAKNTPYVRGTWHYSFNLFKGKRLEVTPMRQLFAGLAVAAALVGFLGANAPTSADSITVLRTFNFLDVRADNTAGLAPGARVSFGADVTPNPRFNGDTGTVVSATQGSITVPSLLYLDSPALPDEYFASVPCPSPCGNLAPPPAELQGAWQLTIANQNSPNSPVTANTPALGAITAPEFVTNMLIGPGPTPTQPMFQWLYPAPGSFDVVSIFIFNLDDRITPGGPARLIFARQGIPVSQQSFTTPAGILSTGVNYSVSIQLDDLRADLSPQGRSRSFFDFRLSANGPPQAFLPTVGPDGVYHFSVLGIVAGQTIFIDPPIAIGYDYAIGAGDPKFKSVLLPEAGDNLYDLYLWKGSAYVFQSTIAANAEFDFTDIVPEGVDRFRILGIEPAAELDPRNAMAFVTGLTFVSTGNFTGTMRPIVAETVSVDLKPGEGPNCVNPKSKGTVAVAVLGGDLDVSTIAQGTLRINSDANPATAGVAPVKISAEDVNGDGSLDLVLHFDTQQMKAAGLLNVSGRTLYVTGEFADGSLFIGSDAVILSSEPACS
jgi:hypothetical protein